MLKFIDEDFVAVRKNKNDKKPALTLAFGEAVEVLGVDGNFTRVRVPPASRWTISTRRLSSQSSRVS